MGRQPARAGSSRTRAQNSELRGHACRVLVSVLVLAGCGETSFSKVQRDIFAAPLELDFGEVYVGSRGSAPLELTNAGRMSQTAQLSLSAPFEAQAEVELAAGSSVQVDVVFLPPEPGTFTSAL